MYFFAVSAHSKTPWTGLERGTVPGTCGITKLDVLQLGMMAAVLGKRSCQLFRRGDAQVADDAAMHGMWVVEIDNLTRKVRTVRRNQLPAPMVGPVVELADQRGILLRGGLNLIRVDGAEVRGPDQLVPVSIRCPAIGKIGSERLQVIAPVAVAQKRDHLVVGEERDVFPFFHGVQVRDERNCDPVVSRDMRGNG